MTMIVFYYSQRDKNHKMFTEILDWLPSYVHFFIPIFYIHFTKKNNLYNFFFLQSNLSYLFKNIRR